MTSKAQDVAIYLSNHFQQAWDSFGFFDDRRKCFRVKNRNLRKHLPIDLNIGFFQETCKLAIAQTLLASRSINAGNPETTEIALLLAAIAVGITKSFHYLLVSSAEQLRVRSAKALG